jgi:hypothetical protein
MELARGADEKDRARGVQIEHVAETFRPMFSGPIIVNTGFDKAKANAVLASGDADLVAFGVPYIPIRILRRGCAPAVRSTSPTRPLSMAKDPKATPTIRRRRGQTPLPDPLHSLERKLQ